MTIASPLIVALAIVGILLTAVAGVTAVVLRTFYLSACILICCVIALRLAECWIELSGWYLQRWGLATFLRIGHITSPARARRQLSSRSINAVVRQ
ncbi:hypothetical protein DFR70_11147 [Nocardia tenerifensis]|uniref:Uncharacterized protein n=1 Tax=Nocardia tenerifensis TaxID=228006 RepID=A0A318JV96_9NOCA|nr:hypothetical protein [Nocardia tenerifensis]PXX59665.1 hypothetical protein DFR70_11147 [Nocardia tenerifensis]